MTDLISQMMEKLNEQTSIREKIYKDLVGHLFAEKNLLMLGRVKTRQMADIVRMIIITDFYARFYEKTSVIYETRQTTSYPYYQVICIEKVPDKKRIISATMDNLLKQILKLTVSEDGKGREEAVKIVEGAKQEIEMSERLKAMGGVQ